MFDALDLGVPVPLDIQGEEVRRAKERDPMVWSDWYDRYFSLLYRYVYARTGQREDAEDVASQAFVRAIESIDRYKYQGTPVLAWLYRITHNLLTDRLRREKSRNFVPLEALVTAIDGEDQAQLQAELNEALQSLKAEQREVIVLSYLVGLTAPEIAALLGKTEAAVYSLRVRAVGNLRKALRA